VVTRNILELAIGEHFDVRPTFEFASTSQQRQQDWPSTRREGAEAVPESPLFMPWAADPVEFLKHMSSAPLQVQRDIARSLRRAAGVSSASSLPSGGSSSCLSNDDDKIQSVTEYCLKKLRCRDGFRFVTTIVARRPRGVLVVEFRAENTVRPLSEPVLFAAVESHLILAADAAATESCHPTLSALSRPGRAKPCKVLTDESGSGAWGASSSPWWENSHQDALETHRVASKMALDSLSRFREQEARHIAKRESNAGKLSRRLELSMEDPLSYWERSKQVVLSGVDSRSKEAFVGLLLSESAANADLSG